MYSEPVDNAERLSTHFADTSRRIADSCPIIDFKKWLTGDNILSFYFHPVTLNEICKFIGPLKNKCNSIDVVPVRIYKHVGAIISPILSVHIGK